MLERTRYLQDGRALRSEVPRVGDVDVFDAGQVQRSDIRALLTFFLLPLEQVDLGLDVSCPHDAALGGADLITHSGEGVAVLLMVGLGSLLEV